MITAIVIARKGSSRIPGKMHQHMGDDTLIMNKIKQLRKCKRVETVLVGSDDTSIAWRVYKEGAEFVERSKEYCDEKSVTVNEVVKDMARHAKTHHILWAHPTNPFISTRDYDSAIDMYFSSEEHDSLFCGTEMKDHFWYLGEPVNHNPFTTPHQVASKLKALIRQNGSMFIRPTADFIKDGRFVGDNPACYTVDETTGWDINQPWELSVARKLLEEGYATTGL